MYRIAGRLLDVPVRVPMTIEEIAVTSPTVTLNRMIVRNASSIPIEIGCFCSGLAIEEKRSMIPSTQEAE